MSQAQALPPMQQAAAFAAAVLAIFLTGKMLTSISAFARRATVLSSVPTAPGGNWLIGHVIPMISCTAKGMGAWDLLESWIGTSFAGKGRLVKFRILDTHCVAFSDPAGLKRVFQTHYKIYEKDLKVGTE